MSTFQRSATIAKPIEALYSFLSDMNNHEQLMPEDIENWTSNTDEARFSIKNMITLALGMTTRTAPREIVCSPIEKSPFPLSLRWTLEAKGAQETTVSFVIEAELNMMLKMMASGPLQKLVDHQVQTLEKLFA